VFKIAIVAGLAVGICVLSVAFATGPKQAENDPPGHEGSDLSAVVGDLTKQITALEKRIEKLEARQQVIAIRPPMVTGINAVPKGWQPREFNGIPYYIVPISERPSER
jgi:hypothetical protein